MADEENKEVAVQDNPDEQKDEGDTPTTPEVETGSPPTPAPEAPEQSEEQSPVVDNPPETDNEGSPTAEGEDDTTSAQAEDTDKQDSADPLASVEEGEGENEADTTNVEESGEEKTPEAEVEAEPVMEDGDGTEQQAAGEGAEGAELPVEDEQQAETGDVAGTPRPEGEETTEGDQAPTEGQEGGEEAPAAPTEGEESKDETGEEGKEAEGEEEEAKEGEEEAEKLDGEEKPEDEEEKEATSGAEGEESTEAKSPVPQSDTFAEGERPESPVAVGEKLSREGTPAQQSAEDYDEALGSPPVPGTPDIGSEGSVEEEEEEEEEEYEEEEPEFDREQLIEKYHQCLAERQQYQDQNYQLQHKLAEYFRKKKSDDNRQEADKNVTDQEQRYLKYMANLDELRRQDAEERDIYKMQIEELKDRCQDKQDKVDDERIKFMEFKRNTGVASINSRSGKGILPKDIEQYLSIENRKEAEVVNVRLENIKLKNKLKKKEHALKSKEELAEGLHLIDFEQLKIENQTYNEKIEERNEELLKLRKKITNTVQVLTHLKEKLQYVQAENQVQQAKLREVEELAARKRDILSRTKQARDALRIDNQKLRQNCGLLGNEPLLRDFEERKDESDDLKYKLEQLKTTHAELTLNLNGVRRKIDQVKSGHQ